MKKKKILGIIPKKSGKYIYRPFNHSISFPTSVDIPTDRYPGLYHWYCILHELGHAYYRERSEFKTWNEYLMKEIKAWGYAYRCLRLKGRKKRDFFEFVFGCLKSYNKIANNRYKEKRWKLKSATRKQLLYMLKREMKIKTNIDNLSTRAFVIAKMGKVFKMEK